MVWGEGVGRGAWWCPEGPLPSFYRQRHEEWRRYGQRGRYASAPSQGHRIPLYSNPPPPPDHIPSLQGLSGIEVHVRTSGPAVAERRGITWRLPRLSAGDKAQRSFQLRLLG